MLISAGDIIKKSYELYKKNWRSFVPFLFLLFLPTLVLSMLGALGVVLSFYAPSTSLVTNLVLCAVVVASFVFSIWTSIALAFEIKNLLENKPAIGWKTIFASSSHLIWPIILTSIMVGVIVLAGTILFIVPGIIFMAWYGFTFYSVIFEGEKGMSALRASKKLVVGRWWEIVWRAAAPALLYGVIVVVLQIIIIAPLDYLLPNNIYMTVTDSLLSTLINVIISPVAAISTIILYLSAKENPISVVEKTP